MKNLKITCLPVRIVLVLVFCVSVALCGVVFYSLRQAYAGQALSGGGGVASASVISASRSGVSATVSPTLTPAPSASVKWTPTA